MKKSDRNEKVIFARVTAEQAREIAEAARKVGLPISAFTRTTMIAKAREVMEAR